MEEEDIIIEEKPEIEEEKEPEPIVKPKKKKFDREEMKQLLDELTDKLKGADSNLYRGDKTHGRANVIEAKTILNKLKNILEDL